MSAISFIDTPAIPGPVLDFVDIWMFAIICTTFDLKWEFRDGEVGRWMGRSSPRLSVVF